MVKRIPGFDINRSSSVSGTKTRLAYLLDFMLHRTGWNALIVVIGIIAAFSVCAQTPEIRSEILVQSSPLAGFKYYAGKALWSKMNVGDGLRLIRERDNVHDENAIRVEWQGHMLGYVPRRENRMLAQQLDNGTQLKARIVRLQKHRSPWKRIQFEVYVEL
jgi:HIRAN domain